MSIEPTYPEISAVPARRGFRGGLFFVTIAFIAGVGVMGWALTQWDVARVWLLGEAKPAETLQLAPLDTALPPPVVAAPPAGGDPQMTARLAAVEARLAFLEANGVTGSGSSSRADALIAAFMARRAVDRGTGLGAAEALLVQQFSVDHGRDVTVIVEGARKPVTLAMLQRDLDALANESAAASGEGWWDSFTSGLSELVTVRSSDAVPTDPAARMKRAQDFMASGQVEPARLEVAQLPFGEKARAWVLNAQRYRDLQAALDRIEAAALTPATAAPPPVAPAPPAAVQNSPADI
jgi:hypothetical protein